MKFYQISVIFLFLWIVSIGVVCAEDANHTAQDALEISENDIALEDSEATYADFETKINVPSGSTVELENDYKYIDTDNTYINLNHVNLTIDGKAKSIDGNSKAGFLNITNHSDVTIKNLLVKNCNKSSLFVVNSKLTLINVTFENNYDVESGAAINASSSNVTSTDNKFLNNYAPSG